MDIKKTASYIAAVVVMIVIAGMAMRSCESKKVCAESSPEDCTYISECKPLLLDALSRLKN